LVTSGNSGGAQIVGNIIGVSTGSFTCISGATYKYNIFPSGSGTCGTGDTTLQTTIFPFINSSSGSGGNYHLSGTADSTRADNLVPTSAGCAPTDYDGQARPADTNCDAGADERSSSTTLPPPPSPKTGDINSDGSVNVLDLSILLSNYGKTAAQSSNPATDLNNDGIINILDLSILLSHYGT
jgi:hypothetical protein